MSIAAQAGTALTAILQTKGGRSEAPDGLAGDREESLALSARPVRASRIGRLPPVGFQLGSPCTS